MPEITGEPTSYFKVDKNNPATTEFVGDKNGELLNEGENGYMPHLAPGFQQKGKSIGQRLSREGYGNIVIEEISTKGWREITKILDELGVEATKTQIENAIIQLEWITWDKPANGN